MAEYGKFITIIDAENNEMDCEILDMVEHEGKEYAILLPVDDQSEEPEAVILERVRLARGAAIDEAEEFRGIEDEATLDAVFAAFLKKNREESGLN